MKVLVLLMFLFSLSACSIVGPGEAGIRVSFGSVTDDVKTSGVYLWFPVMLGMKKIDTRIQKNDVETQSASKDLQEISTHVVVNWSIGMDKVVTLYKTVGDEEDIYERLIAPAVNEVMKSCTAKRTAEEVLTKRFELKQDVDSQLRERLSVYGIVINDISFVNVAFSKDFMNAVENKQVAEQRAKQAEYEALKAVQDAKSEVERAKGQAASQQLVRSTLTPEILQQQAIEKWNGQFPQVMGSQTLPFINVK